MPRRVSCLIVVLLLTAACTATEKVTITQAALPRATQAPEPAIEPTSPPAAEPTIAPASEPTARERTEPTAISAPAAGESRCVYLGPDSFDDMQIELHFTSAVAEQSDVTVAYSVVDADGVALVESSAFVEDLAPGEVLRYAVDTVTDVPTDSSGITCTVGEVSSADFGFEDFVRSGPDDSCRFVEVDFADDVQIELTFTNPFEDGAAVAVDYALRGADGVRYGDGVAYLDTTAEGEPSTHPADTFRDLPSWISEADFSCDILAIYRN